MKNILENIEPIDILLSGFSLGFLFLVYKYNVWVIELIIKTLIR